MKQCSHCLRFLPDARFALIRRKSGNKHLASWCNQCIQANRTTPVRDLTAEQLRKELHYDPETGVFTRLANRSRTDLVGATAGGLAGHGYRTISVGRTRHYAHRLAWLYMTGEWPVIVDHINGDRADNRWSNLRASTFNMNVQNVRVARTNSASGYLGVYYCKTTGRWRAMLRVGKQRKCLGRFDTPEEAYAVYLAAKRENHEGCTI